MLGMTSNLNNFQKAIDEASEVMPKADGDIRASLNDERRVKPAGIVWNSR